MAVDDENSKPLSISNALQISRPVYQEGFPVSWHDWDRVKERVGRCKVSVDWWAVVGSFFFGIGTVGLSVALTAWAAEAGPVSNQSTGVFWGLTFGGFFVGGVCSAARWFSRGVQHQSISDVVEEMTHIERRYERPSQEASSPGQ